MMTGSDKRNVKYKIGENKTRYRNIKKKEEERKGIIKGRGKERMTSKRDKEIKR